MGESTAIVSLLGQKPNGMSEFVFYSFAAAKEVEGRLQRTALRVAAEPLGR